MTPGIRTAGYITVALIMGAAVSGVWVHFSGQAKRASRSAAVADSLRRVAEAERDSIRRRESWHRDSIATATTARLDSLASAQLAVAREAARLRSMIPAPDTTVRDSLRYWHATASSALAEVGALRATVVTKDSAIGVRDGTIARLTAEAKADARRIAEQDRTIASLNARLSIQPAGRGCRVLGVLSCPSRTTSFVSGVAVTALATLYAVAQ